MQLTKLSHRLSLLPLAILLCMPGHAVAQAGQLDSTFANRGIFTGPVGATGYALAIQSDGKIVIAGTGILNNAFSFMLIRLNTNGTLDNNFGTGGVVNLIPSGVYTVFGLFGLAIQSDGKILAGAASGGGPQGDVIQVARFETNGSLDTSFGTEGFTPIVAVPTGISGNIALQPDGAILAAAGMGNPSEMARFTSSGQLDTTFGSGGIVNLANPGPTQIAVQPNGQILVGSGEPSRLVSQPQPAAQAGTISRYNADGTLDKTFGASGTVSSVASVSALVLESTGKIVVAGVLTSKVNAPPTQNNLGFGVARYNSNGTIDKTFGAGGVAIADFGPSAPASAAYAAAVQSNGDIVAGGAAGSAGNVVSSFGLARFTSAGKLDATFGSGGIVMTTVAANQYSWVAGLEIQSDGKIVAVGSSGVPGSQNSAPYAARYLAQ